MIKEKKKKVKFLTHDAMQNWNSMKSVAFKYQNFKIELKMIKSLYIPSK